MRERERGSERRGGERTKGNLVVVVLGGGLRDQGLSITLLFSHLPLMLLPMFVGIAFSHRSRCESETWMSGWRAWMSLKEDCDVCVCIVARALVMMAKV